MERKTTLLPYQQKAYTQGFKYLINHKAFGALYDMGTGKTITALYLYEFLLSTHGTTKCIIICPKTIMSTWVDQLKEHLGSDDYLLWKNNTSQRYMQELGFFIDKPGGVFIVNTEAFQTENKLLDQVIRRICVQKTLMVLDESSFIKSPTANRTRRLLSMAKLAEYRMILTGTEITKNVLDLYTQGEFLQEGYWGIKNFYAFRARYAIMADIYGPGGRLIRNGKYVGAKDIEDLKTRLMRCCVRITKADALPDLPPKRYQTIMLEMPATIRKIYDAMKHDMVAFYKDRELTVSNKAVLFGRFRQICGGIFPDPIGVSGLPSMCIDDNIKIDVIKTELEDTDQQAIIWACYTDEIKALAHDLQCPAIYGDVVQADRDNILAAFKAGEFKTLVLNPGVAAFGLNLQYINLVYYYSNPLRADHRWQSEDRCHRVGTKSAVLYKDLIYKDSIDERVKKILDEKTKLREEFRDGGLNNTIESDIMQLPKEQFYDLF